MTLNGKCSKEAKKLQAQRRIAAFLLIKTLPTTSQNPVSCSTLFKLLLKKAIKVQSFPRLLSYIFTKIWELSSWQKTSTPANNSTHVFTSGFEMLCKCLVRSHFLTFFYQELVATTGVPDLPFAGDSHRPKTLKNPKKKKKKKESSTHTLIHTHICSYTP